MPEQRMVRMPGKTFQFYAVLFAVLGAVLSSVVWAVAIWVH